MKATFAVAGFICVVCLLLMRLGFDGGSPGLSITTRRDGRTAGNLGIGLALRGVNPSLARNLKADIVIRTLEGTVVHEDTADVDRFTFG